MPFFPSFMKQLLLSVIVFVSFAFGQNTFRNNLSDEALSQLFINRYKNISSASGVTGITKVARQKHNLTMLLVEVKRNWDRLTPEAKRVFSVFETRPTGLNQTYTETIKNYFKFYYTTSGSDAVPTADANSNGVPDYVENMAVAFCKALSFYDSVGFNHPPIAAIDNGKYAVYISSSNAGDYVYGYSMPENTIGDNPATALTEVTSTTSYMVMRNEYDDFGNTAAEKQIAMEVTAAHEFFHAVQFGYEYDNMEGYLMEMASTWAEDKVFPGDDDNWQYLYDIFTTPDVSTDWDEYLDGDDVNFSSDYSMHWYAVWIFMRYLTDQYDNQIPRQIFEANISNNTSAAINTVLINKGSSYTTALKDYYVAIALLTQSSNLPQSRYRFQRANDYRTKTVNSGGSPAGPFIVKYENSITYTGTKVTYSSTTKGNKRLMRASADFLKIIPTGNFSISVTPKVTGTNFSIRLIKSDTYTNPAQLSVIEPTIAGNTYSINVPDRAAYNNYVLVVYNAKYSTPASRDTTSIQYDITVDKAQLTDGIQITSPVGSETWQIGTSHLITWESANVTNVKIEYTTNNGVNWNLIIASTTASAGMFSWTVPSTPSAQCKIRISDVANSASFSVSPAEFSIIQPLPFGLISPNGGESWSAGSNQAITWNGNAVQNIKIELSTDNGVQWSVISASVNAVTGNYTWTVPNSISNSCKIKISDVTNSAITSQSSNVFAIIPAVVQTTVLLEDFSKVTTGSIATPGTNDVSATLDQYTLTAGWSGSKIYTAGGAFKIGSSSAQGYIITPTINLSSASGKGTVNFDLQTFGTDTTAMQVYLSTDGGLTFTQQLGADVTVTTGMVSQSIPYFNGNTTSKIKFTAKTAVKNRFYIDNVRITSGGSTGIDDEQKHVASVSGFILAQNYPNPFNPTTNIQFTLNEYTFVQLHIYNQLGEKIATLVESDMSSGTHTITWNAQNAVSGVYFCQMKASGNTVIRKIVLMK